MFNVQKESLYVIMLFVYQRLANDRQDRKRVRETKSKKKNLRIILYLYTICFNLIAVFNSAINLVYRVSFYIHWLYQQLITTVSQPENRRTNVIIRKIRVIWRMIEIKCNICNIIWHLSEIYSYIHTLN